MDDFNPDEYLASKTNSSTDFDPDKYLSEKSVGGFMSNVGQNAKDIAGTFNRAVKGVTDMPKDYLEMGKGMLEGKPFTETPIGQDVKTLGTMAGEAVPHLVNQNGLKLEPGSVYRQYEDIAAQPLKYIPGKVGEEVKKAYPKNPFYDKPLDTALAIAPLTEGVKMPGGKFMKNTGQSIEASATMGALDLNPPALRKLSKRGQNPETVALNLNKKINELMPNLVETLDTPSSKYQKLLDANESASRSIGQVIDATTAKTGNKLPEARAMIDELRSEANSPRFKSATSQRNIDARAELLDAASHLEELEKSGQLNFRNLYEVKKGIGEAYHNTNFENAGVDKAYGIIKDKIDEIVDRASIDNPSLKDSFNHSKEVFKLTSDILPVMQKGVTRDVAGGGGLSNTALGAVAVTGHAVPAAGAYVGKTLAKAAFPDLARNLTYKAVNGLKNLPSAPDMNQMVAAYLASHFSDKNKK